MMRLALACSLALALACSLPAEGPPVLDRDGEVVSVLPPGAALRVALVHEGPELRYLAVSTGVRVSGDARVHCPEAVALLLSATYADDEGRPLAGAPIEAAASHAGERCPSLVLAAPGGAVMVVEVEGIGGRAQPGREVVLEVEGLD